MIDGSPPTAVTDHPTTPCYRSWSTRESSAYGVFIVLMFSIIRLLARMKAFDRN